MNPLLTIKWSLVVGFAAAVLIAVLLGGGWIFNGYALARWLHILSGVMWIGLLYYFNVVQVPGLAVAAADKGGPGGAGVAKYIAPLALLWFRWAAVATFLAGCALLLYTPGRFVNAFTFGTVGDIAGPMSVTMGIGVWFGTIMLFNVWALIWPNQKKILGIVPATDEEKARARKVALLASRTNFVLSIPMLLCMGASNHPLPF